MRALPTQLLQVCLFWDVAAVVMLAPAWAQAPGQIVSGITTTQFRTLPGNVHPLARPEFDRGPAPANLPMDRMLLVLNRSTAQEADLQSLLAAQQDPSSPQFHQWLTPQQFGARFGATDADIQTVTAWLQSQGFTVDRVSNGKTIIEFSGMAQQVQYAFHTEIHKYVVNGEEHWANASNPGIPASLASIVAGVATLHNFVKATQLIDSGQRFVAQLSPQGKPQFTSSTGLHALSPGDYRIIYNVQPPPIYKFEPTVAVVGRSNIQPDDITFFKQYFLNEFDSPPMIILNGPDPGDLGGGEEVEAVLDTSWATATSGDANIELVISKTTNTTDGVDLSEEYIIDKNVATVMTESFGSCEAYYTQTQAAFYSSLAQQAAAQGITYVVAAGDSGSSGCDLGSDSMSSGQLSTNILASNPYVTAVGGTQFNEDGNDSAYWASTNSSANSANYISALSYIPEDAWNESCTASTGVNPCTNGNSPGLWAGGGGASTFYGKPSWQSGVSGIPNDGARDIPDVSLTAAGHDPYLICLDGSCTPNSLGQISFYGYAGTSAATPSFAGFVALLTQQAGRLGSINPLLYQIAANETFANCNASIPNGLATSGCVFNDITIGNNSVPGEPGYNTSSGTYQSHLGYDLTTGLGSINEGNLGQAIEALSAGTPVLTLSATTLAFGDVTIGSSKTLQVTVSNTGTGILQMQLFSIGSDQYYMTGCAALIFAGQSCTLSLTFTPTRVGPASGFPAWLANTRPYEMTLTGTGVAAATASVSAASLSFGNQKIITRSAAQSISIVNSTLLPLDASNIEVTGDDPEDFLMGNTCGTTIPSGSGCTIYVLFAPLFAGTRSASISIPVDGSGTQQTVALSGTGTMSGYFELFNARTGKVLEVAGASSAGGALIQQNALNGSPQQQWEFIPTANGSYEIANALTGKVMDVISASTKDGGNVQQYDYLEYSNQQWQLTPVDDVHYVITNINSNKVLDIPNGNMANNTPVQQWDYLGDEQQLWVLVPIGSYNITNNLSSDVLDVVSASTSAGAQIDQATPDGLRDQQWQLVPVGGGYYAIWNQNGGEVLDDTGGSSANGNILQQFDYLAGDINQQWQLVPLDNVNYKIVNRRSGKVLDDTSFSTTSGTPIQQWNYTGNTNQQWQLNPVIYYNIVNRLSGLVLDVPSASTADGEVIQQWASNGSRQQQWQLVLMGNNYAIMNNASGKALEDANSSTSDGALIEQFAYSGASNQQWQLIPVGGGYFEIQNLASGKVLDDTAYSAANGTLIQQWDYLGDANQQWQLVPVGN